MDPASKAQRELQSIEREIERLEAAAGDNQEAQRQLHRLHAQVEALRQQLYAHLSAWQKTELARHPQRPYTLDYAERVFTGWTELHGDRVFGDDPAIVCGMATFHGEEIMVIGHQKARDTKQKVYRNFGMPNPEGYRKALRIPAADLRALGCVDEVVPEPEGGAHSDHEVAAALLDSVLQKNYCQLKKIPATELVAARYNKFRQMAQFFRED